MTGSKSNDIGSLKNPRRPGGGCSDLATLRPPANTSQITTTPTVSVPAAPNGKPVGEFRPESRVFEASAAAVPTSVDLPEVKQTPGAAKQSRRKEKDKTLLAKDRWLLRSGHFLTYACLYLFSIMVFFRPYEIVPGLGFLSGTAVVFAVATLLVFIPSQLVSESNLTILSTEVKAVLALALIAVITMPLAKSPGVAWDKFNDPFIKVVAIFIVMVNVVRTRKRLMGLVWLSLGIGVYLAIAALHLYMQGKFSVEEYRVAVDVGGMFGNPNEMAMHFVMMTPIALTLALATKGIFWRILYAAMTFLFIAANMVTFSRGGFIGLIACSAVMAWKLGRRSRVNVTIGSIVVGGITLIAAPGNYGLRMLSIFIPGLDAVGSSDQRQELLIRSLQVTARNPWGIGIGNFPIVGVRNLQSHNAFTQVSSELGILGLIAYIVLMVSPFRKLGAIERSLFAKNETDWFYYLAIGLQASIVGYMVSSFFASVAYNWFIYYLIGYAVAFRRIYSIETGRQEESGIAPETAPAAA